MIKCMQNSKETVTAQQWEELWTKSIKIIPCFNLRKMGTKCFTDGIQLHQSYLRQTSHKVINVGNVMKYKECFITYKGVFYYIQRKNPTTGKTCII